MTDYSELNGNIEIMANLVKDYYLKEIVPTFRLRSDE